MILDSMHAIRRTSRATSPTSPIYSPKPKSTAKAAVFVVHGMGSQVEGYGRFAKNLSDLRKTSGEVLFEDLNGCLEADEVAWIPIEWHSVVHGLSSVDARMHLVTLPTTPVFRQINNDMLADVLYFFSSFHGAKIMEIVAGVINTQYAKFMQENPEFNGPICILAHSLGGIITYDLLVNQDIAVDVPDNKEANGIGNGSCRTHFEISYPKLAFKPNMLVTLGSQVAAVMIMRGQSLDEYKLPEGILYRNVFHLYDPLAYRIEPLIDPRYAEISPVLIQRPSSVTKGFNLAYYRSLSKLFSSYLPSLPNIPNDLNFQNMLPAMAMSFPQIGLPDLGFSAVTAAGGGFPELIPKSFTDVRRAVIESMYSFAGNLFSENGGGGGEGVVVAGTKRSHDRDVSEIGDVAQEGSEDDREREEPKHKRRRVEKEIPDVDAEGLAGVGKFGRKIAKPRAVKHTAVSEASQMSEPRTPTLGQGIMFEPSPSALADGVIETIRGAVRRMSAAFTVFDDDRNSEDIPSPNLTKGEEENESSSQTHVRSIPADHLMPPRHASQQNVEEVLTEEFAAAAERVLKRDPSPARESHAFKGTKEEETTSSAEKPLPLKERLDYFVTETVMDNTVHQYLIGMRAHFAYWGNKDMMFHILSTLLDLRKDQPSNNNKKSDHQQDQ
ncbi:UNVERIFIED_CONTAM: hypothetical protein HDU68_002481 [Siphonaria sp. JEL0065]|nr:hypothetical protein HDU68_002481 [Siphonaria sp. JEL0065]